jgi:hypothetical protein
MVTARDLRRIVLALPETVASDEGLAFSVRNKGKLKGLAWAWMERVHPKKARVPNHEVLAVRVADETAKEALLSADPRKFFTEPHYNGYPAVLVRLAEVSKAEISALLHEAWRIQAPRDLVAGKPPPRRRQPSTSRRP